MKTLFLVLLAALSSLDARADGAAAKPAEAPARDTAPPANMEKFYLVLLRRAPNAPKLEQAALEELQKKHLGHLRAMYEAGHMAIAGPFDEQQDPTLRGMCLYKTATAAEARAFAEQDPMFKSGRLVFEVMAWWVEKGYLKFTPPPGPALK